jgi:hypothetical protein
MIRNKPCLQGHVYCNINKIKSGNEFYLIFVNLHYSLTEHTPGSVTTAIYVPPGR